MGENNFDIEQELCKFVRDGRSIEFDEYLHIHSDVSNLLTTIIQQHNEYFTLLMLAALNGHDEVVRLLLSHSPTGIEVEGSVYDSEGNFVEHITALWCALDRGHFEVARTLIDFGEADVNHGPYYPLLIDASKKGRLDIVQFLLENGYADVNQTITNDANKYSSLILSAHYGHKNVVAYLLDIGADIEYRAHAEQNTALTTAAREGHLTIIQLLCWAGASINVKNHNGKTPMMLVAERDAFEAIDFLLEYIHDETTFDDLELVASSYITSNNVITLDERQRMVRLLRKSLEQRVLFNVQKTVSQPIAAYDFQKECETIDELDQIQYDNDRLCIEALLICERILLVLEQTTASNEDRRSIIIWIRKLCQKQYTTTEGQNLLHMSVNPQTCYGINYRPTDIIQVLPFPNLDSTQLLLAYGQQWIDVNARDQNRSDTALHIVSRNFDQNIKENVMKIIEILLNANAHIDYVNYHGKTPFDEVVDTDIRFLLQSKHKLPRLKCLCARLITIHQITYDHVWPKPTALTNFVQLHNVLPSEDEMGFGLFD
ncbi:unnamed protein product [Rotaria sp. Silwood1]|nr:unnamed protein product [Rotaria sp. Silwood1]